MPRHRLGNLPRSTAPHMHLVALLSESSSRVSLARLASTVAYDSLPLYSSLPLDSTYVVRSSTQRRPRSRSSSVNQRQLHLACCVCQNPLAPNPWFHPNVEPLHGLLEYTSLYTCPQRGTLIPAPTQSHLWYRGDGRAPVARTARSYPNHSSSHPSFFHSAKSHTLRSPLGGATATASGPLGLTSPAIRLVTPTQSAWHGSGTTRSGGIKPPDRLSAPAHHGHIDVRQ